MPPLSPQPDVLAFFAGRRSRPAKTLVAPAPDRAALEPILALGLRVPDHGKLEPWRLIVLEGTALETCAQRAEQRCAALGFAPERVEKTAMMFRNAPLIVTVVESPVDSEKVPYFEQTLSAGAVCQNLLSAALASGWGANWLSGPLAIDADFGAKALDLRSEERVAGFIVIGTETATPPERPRPDLSQKVQWRR